MNRVQLLTPSLSAATPLQNALAQRGVPCELATLDTLRLDVDVRRRMDTVVNLLSDGLDAGQRLLAAEVLGWLGDIGARVVNGLDAFVVGSSPARQLALFAHLGLEHPPSRVVGSADLIDAARQELALAAPQTDVVIGPPVIVRGLAVGDPVRVEFVGGQLTHSDAQTPLPDLVVAAAAEVLGTASVEFGAVRLSRVPTLQGEVLTWLGVDTSPALTPESLEALADYVAFKAS